METIIKIVSWVCVIIVAVHGAVSAFFGKSKKLAWLKLKISRIIFFVITVLAACFTIISSYYGDKASAVREKKLDDKLKKAEEALNVANEKVDAANEKLDESVKANEKLKGLVSDQSKSISSLVFNMETSLEGKVRFVDNFETISLLSKFDSRKFEYHCQICEEGVAVFWFGRDDEKLKGFYFFSNSEINVVLASKPFSENFISDEGVVEIDRDKELFVAYTRGLHRKLPQKSSSAVAQIKIERTIDVELKKILYYVYRAIPGTAEIKTYQYSNRHLLSGDRRVSFSYYVDPLAKSPIMRSVTVDLSYDFILSLCGITWEEFGERIVEKLRSMNIEAKVTPGIIEYMNSQGVKRIAGANQDRENSDLIIHANIKPDSNGSGGSIVGYSNTEIREGVNCIEVSFKSIDVFTTLAKILKFSPAQALVGDTISFYLDGGLQSYEVVSWDENEEQYVIESKGKKEPRKTTFDSIPNVERYWITHTNKNPISITDAGVVGGKNVKVLKASSVSQYDGTVIPRRISVKMVGAPGVK